jgi:hypothetical protein
MLRALAIGEKPNSSPARMIAKARKEARRAFERAWAEFKGTARHSMLTDDAAAQLERALERKAD